jgi:hypothetical protein
MNPLDALQAKAQAANVPDIPPCDYCGTNWTGNLFCSQCQMVFFCSKECQKVAWKQGGHKRECPKLQLDNERAPKEAVNRMKDTSLSPLDRINQNDRDLFDIAGPYKLTLKEGLNEAIQQLFQEDMDSFFNKGISSSYDAWVMTTLFRGNRQEGRDQSQGDLFSQVDPYRVRRKTRSRRDEKPPW